VAFSEKVTDSASTAPAAGAGSTAALFGLTVMTGVPLETAQLLQRVEEPADLYVSVLGEPRERLHEPG
jgi:hypothetical protein